MPMVRTSPGGHQAPFCTPWAVLHSGRAVEPFQQDGVAGDRGWTGGGAGPKPRRARRCRRPHARGEPVAVGGSRERGVVAAASYEARAFGVRSAMPSVTAKRRCPDLIFVKPRFDVYKAVSLQIREIFAAYTAIIEPLSLDEAYLDVTENLKGIVSLDQQQLRK
jgi:hypothetical protein